MTIDGLKKQIITEIERAFEAVFSRKPNKLELGFPPNIEFGDFAAAFFAEAKELGMSPVEIAQTVAKDIPTSDIIEKSVAAGPYVNIKIKNEILFGVAISEILENSEAYGNSKEEKGKKVMVEYLSPNTNKPLHLGHVRNGAIGMAVSNILSSQGDEVIKANLINDRGVHICKSMLAWSKWGNGKTPESAGMKGDHFVGKWYVRYAMEEEKNPELKNEIQEMLQKWEAGDSEIMALWKKMNEWVYAGFDETYRKLGFEFDKLYFESETYKLGKDIVEEGIEKNVFRRDESGEIVFDLPEDQFGLDRDGQAKRSLVLRADGTSVYMTQDLGTVITRAKEYDFDQLLYVVGSEQIAHFQALFKIVDSLGYSWAKGLKHLAYGMVYLPEGKMKSREGKVVDADNLIADVEKLVTGEIKKRNPEITDVELDTRTKKIAIGAIKFHMLRYRPTADIHFDPKESIALDGFTGPYCQYAYARISGILRNAEEKNIRGEADYSMLEKEEELLLIQKLIEFPEIMKLAAEEMNPLRITTQVWEIAKAFNQFYNSTPVLNAENENLVLARLELIKAAAVAIKKGLDMLGIEVSERM